MEELNDRRVADRTSLGVFRPRRVRDLKVTEDKPDWKPSFGAALRQARLWDHRTVSKAPPRKVPYKFHYEFDCADRRCQGHRMMIVDWEVGALFWRLVDRGYSQREAAERVRAKFLGELCGPSKDTHFFVGTILAHPHNWVVIGVFYPKIQPDRLRDEGVQALFDLGLSS